MARVSVIIVNYNGKGVILNCLKALEGQSFRDFEVIVVDNNSVDDSLNEIQNFLEESSIASFVKLIPLDKNSGFARGNLEGLKHTKGKYIALLNNDTEPDMRWLEELVKTMGDDPDIGICASKLMVYGTDVIDSAGDGFSTFLKGFKRGEGNDIFLYKESVYVFGACAGAALYRRKMLEEIGFLDENFFLIHEDTDLNVRAQLAGWKVLYVPTAIVHHKVRSSIGQMSDMAVYYTLRNSEFVRIKNIPAGVFLRCLPEFILGIIIEFIYFAIKHKQFRLYLKAKTDALQMMPKMLRKRAEILNNRKVSNKYLISIMTPVWKWSYLKSKIRKLVNG